MTNNRSASKQAKDTTARIFIVLPLFLHGYSGFAQSENNRVLATPKSSQERTIEQPHSENQSSTAALLERNVNNNQNSNNSSNNLHTVTANEQTNSARKNNEGYKCGYKIDSKELIDRVRASTHTRLCNTAGWIDSLFGDQEPFRGDKFRGKIVIGFKQDEIEGLDPRLRVRIKTKLPNVSKRFNAFFGRVEEDSFVANTEVNEDRLTNVGLRSTNDDDSEWLVGLGYRGPRADYNGWDYSVGAKLSGGFRPYARAAHRYVYQLNKLSYFNTTQTVFWRRDEGFGVSSNGDYTRFIGDNDIWVSHASVKYTEEKEQLEWFADTRWHHSFSSKRGISSSAYVRGEAENEVPIPEFGLTFTYIRPVLRDWIYMETGVDLRWERQFRSQPSYKSAIRFGIQFEMLMGDYYRRGRRK